MNSSTDVSGVEFKIKVVFSGVSCCSSASVENIRLLFRFESSENSPPDLFVLIVGSAEDCWRLSKLLLLLSIVSDTL